MSRILLIGLSILFCVALHGQQVRYVKVREIQVEGNEKTRDYIVFRDMDFNVGDSISIEDLPHRLERSRFNLINTSLFTQVNVNVSNWDTDIDEIDILVTLQENWYLYIVPIAELADRNFNVWWNEFNGSLSRVNLGLRLQHLNLSGNNDRLKILAQLGFTRKFEVEYGFPYLNEANTIGATVGFLHSTNKETGYLNFENRLLFTEQNENQMLRRNRFRVSLFHRPNIYSIHELKTEYHNNKVNTQISDTLNLDYFLNRRSLQRFFSFTYKYQYDRRDVRIYPLEGLSFELEVNKNGIGIWNDIDMLTISPSFSRYVRPLPWFSVGTRLSGKISIIRKQPPWYQNQGLGFGRNFVRGYELYVIDGQDYFLSKSSAKFRILEKKINFGDLMFIDQFKVMPIQVFFTVNFDLAYVNEEFYQVNNDFTNRWLYGGGPGIDVVLYNNFLFQFELSANHAGEVGLFIHNSVSF